MARKFGGFSIGQIRDALMADPMSAAWINAGACVVTANPVANMVGDGVTDNGEAWGLIHSNYDHIRLPHGSFLFSSGNMNIGNRKTVEGAGYLTSIVGDGIDDVITIGDGGTTDVDEVILKDLAIAGTANNSSLKMNNAQNSQLTNIYGQASGPYGFWFASVWGSSKLHSLRTNGVSHTTADFYTDSAFNGNDCSGWYTSGFSPSNFELRGINQGTFHNLNAQGGTLGLNLRGASGPVFSGIYSENCGGHALGVYTSELVDNTVFSGGVFHCGGSFSPLSALDINYAEGVTFNSVGFPGAFSNLKSCILTGGGGSGGVVAARIHTDGTVHDLLIIKPGTGYTSPPTLTLAVPGSGFAGTTTLSGTSLATASITTPGTDYTVSGAPSAIRYKRCSKILVNAPYLNSGFGLNSAFYPMICRQPGADAASGIMVNAMSAGGYAGGGTPDAIMRKAEGYGYVHYVETLDSSGTPRRWAYVPPELDAA